MTTKEINILIDEAQSLKQITQIFTQIASSKLKKIRVGVERNREFFKDLSDIYGLINIIARYRKVPLMHKNGKTLTILLSSNERFYGKITSELMEFFLVQVSKIRSDKIVIGKSAIESLSSLNYVLTYKPLILASDFPTSAEFLTLSEIVKDYSRVLVFHPQFQSVLVQLPVISDITHSQEAINTTSAQTKELARLYNSFIVEPEIKIMADFFESQIKVLLLETTFLEAELARTASRLITMDRAQNEADKYLSGQQLLLFNARRSIANARILETIAGLSGSAQMEGRKRI